MTHELLPPKIPARFNQTIGGSDNIDPAGLIQVSGQATAVIGYSGGGAALALPADRFTAYLRQYGLDQIVDERNRRGESALPGRERFYRYAKALLTGRQTTQSITQPLGFIYEIVPDEDPTMGHGVVRGHVVYDGLPVAGVLIEAYHQGDPASRLGLRTDSGGGFSFTLPQPGIWLLRSVHMIRAGFFANNDWTSLWASLTFEQGEHRS